MVETFSLIHCTQPVVMNRIMRLAHPPVLYRGTKPLYYGRGIPAPWNSHPMTTTDGHGGGVPPTPNSTTSVGALALPSPRNKAKDREAENGGENGNVGEGNERKSLIPDAQLFATWDFESKDFKVPVVSGGVMLGSASRMHRGKVGRDVGRDVAVDGASVGVGVGASGSGGGSSSSMVSVSVSVGAGGRTKAGLKS